MPSPSDIENAVELLKLAQKLLADPPCPHCHGTRIRWTSTALSPAESCPCRDHGDDEKKASHGE